jgi:hypothetical protein
MDSHNRVTPRALAIVTCLLALAAGPGCLTAIVASGGGGGGDEDGPTTASIGGVFLSGSAPYGGAVTLNFSVFDDNSDNCDIEIHFKLGFSGTYGQVSSLSGSVNGLSSSPFGVAHSVG